MDAEVRFGKACIAGTRVDVATVVGALAAGDTTEAVAEAFQITQRQLLVGRVGRWRGSGFDDADVSIALPKIPYGEFSPVRLQGQPVRSRLPA
jgi:hypothetical protein